MLCNTLLCADLDSHSWSDYEYMHAGVDFNMCKNLEMTLHSQMNPISHLKASDKIYYTFIAHVSK